MLNYCLLKVYQVKEITLCPISFITQHIVYQHTVHILN